VAHKCDRQTDGQYYDSNSGVTTRAKINMKIQYELRIYSACGCSCNLVLIDSCGCIYFCVFLLLAHCVPNVAKRSIQDQYKKKYILRTDRPATDQRPTTSHLGKFQMAISLRGVVRSTSTVGFSRSADRMALIPV